MPAVGFVQGSLKRAVSGKKTLPFPFWPKKRNGTAETGQCGKFVYCCMYSIRVLLSVPHLKILDWLLC